MICFVGCNNNGQDDRKLLVAVTIAPEATFVQKVGGDLVNVTTLVPPGHSPEAYELTALQMIKFSDADIYFSIGVSSEVAILPLATMKTVALAERVAEEYPDKMLGKDRDPHIWLSPKRVVIMVRSIATELALIDTENALIYTANAEKYIDEIESTSALVTEILSDVTNRKFVAFHPAYGYFAEEFELEMFALEEEGQEASPQHMREVIDAAKANNITVVFYQAETDSAQAQAIAEDLNGTTIELKPLATNYIENLLSIANALKKAMK